MSDSWYGVGRGLCLISIMLTKLDFNVHMVSVCICKQCHSCGKKVGSFAAESLGFHRFL